MVSPEDQPADLSEEPYPEAEATELPTPEPNSAEPEKAPSDLGKRAVRGGGLTFAAQALRFILQMAALVTLARLLDPTDYGLITMVMTIVGVADTFRDFGLSSAAIQSPTLTRPQQINLFWINTALGTTLTTLAIVFSPLIARMYGRPELVAITCALAANFLINGMATQYRADLNRRMRFRQLAIADVSGPFLGLAVAIVLALSGAGYWALVAQQLVTAGTMFILVVVGAGWLPKRWSRDADVKPFLAFGWRLVGSQLIGYIGNNFDSFMIGLRIGASPLGVYNRARQLIMNPLGQVRAPLNAVAIPVLSRLQNEEDRYQSYVARGQMLIGYTMVAGLAFVAGAAEPIVRIVLGPSWVETTNAARFLAIAACFTSLSFVGYWVYVTKGIVDHLLGFTILSAAFRIIAITIASGHGLTAVAVAVAIEPACMWPVSLWWLSKRASIPVGQLWAGGFRVTLFASVIFGVSFASSALVAHWNDWAQLGTIIVAAVAAYALMVALIPPVRRDVASVWALAKNFKR